ncbi:DUF805 domain-containing protein [Caulobacter sp. RL271]|uniref:DUF805 domain-containing protein n=1 Tax=Caulobacter segnis TaxID=88688 RepID=A0ABY4ZSE2_9CAUL|nr:DUF805 domain-containing protein [Caulobacter segnis]USQ95643.1 DUF805 domain-containing protein [Caulobacter segnis]
MTRGRLTPLQYWRLQLRLMLALAVVAVVTCLATIAGGWLGAAPCLFAIPIFLAGLIAGLRRLHDRGKGVVWLAIFTLGPAALAAPARLIERGASAGLMLGALLLALAGLLLTIWAWIEIGFLRGQKGPNRYGPDPRALSSAA